MFGNRKSTQALLLFLVVLVIALPACSGPAPTAVPTQAPPTATVQPPSPTPLPPTATSEPTATNTPEPTATPVPPTATATAIPHNEMVTTWCIPQEKAMFIKAPEDATTMPEGALPGKFEKDLLVLTTPAQSCTIVFRNGQPIPEGAKLVFTDGMGQSWLTAALVPSPKDPLTGYATLTHA